MQKSSTLLVLLFALFSKVLLCQNFLNYNSTPYTDTYSDYFCSDSLQNKYSVGALNQKYSSSIFYLTVSSLNDYVIIKYDSLNNVIFYKKISTDGSFPNLCYNKGFLYLIFKSHSQYTYDNITTNTSNNLIILKINTSTGNISTTSTLTSYPAVNSNSAYKNTYIANDKIYLVWQTNSAINYLGTPINSGLFIAQYSLNGSFMGIRNFSTPTDRVNGILELNQYLYLTGAAGDTAGVIHKLDLNLNTVKTIAYGSGVFSPFLLNNNILVSAEASYYNPESNKGIIKLCMFDSSLQLIKESFWGLKTANPVINFMNASYRRNHHSHLNLINNRIVISHLTTESKDSSIGCISSGKTSTNIFINIIDTNFNCLSSLQISNGPYYNNLNGFNNEYGTFYENIRVTSSNQVSLLLSSFLSPNNS